MCFQTIVKFLLFFFNFVFWLGGVTLIGLGVWSLVLGLIPENFRAIPTWVIAVGSVIFIISFSGCCGALRESSCLLKSYAIFMFILAAAMAYPAYVVFALEDNIRAIAEEWLEDAFEAHKNDTNLPFGILETAFGCCGTTGADSYVASDLTVPPTCCPQLDFDICTLDSSYGGCSELLDDFIHANASAVGRLIIAVIIVELLAMMAALYMNSTITKKNRSNNLVMVYSVRT